MDVTYHKKNASSEQEIHTVHLCHNCGWPFPNPHPSAKHRRAHKRVCGTLEGYKLINSGSDHSNLAGSDNEHISDDERLNPSPNSGKRSIKESVNSEVGIKSNHSEDELFSDAIPEFSNNPSLDKNVGRRGEGFHDLEDNHVPKDEKTAGMNQPQHGSIMVGEISDNAVMRGEMNHSETTETISDTGNAKVADAVSGRTCLESNSSLAVSELIVVSDSFHDTSELIVVSDSTKIDRETGKVSSSLGQYIRDNEKGDETSEDVHCATTSEVLQSEHKLGIELKLEDIGVITSRTLVLETRTTEIGNETLDPEVQYDSQIKLNNVNVETSHARIVRETANKEVLANNLQFKHDASSQTKHYELQDAFSVSEVESDSPKHFIQCSPCHSNEVCDAMEAGSESTPFLSPAETSPAEENSLVTSRDFKDYEMLKSGVSLDLQAAEEDRSPENDKKSPIPENFQDAVSNLPDGSVDWSYLNPLGSKVEKHVSTPGTRALFISVTEKLPSTTAKAFAETIDEHKEQSVSITIDGEIGTVVPDLPSAPESSIEVRNVAFTSEKLYNIQNVVSDVSDRSIDIYSSDAFNGEPDKVAILTPIDGETGMAVPENLSSVPCGTEDNSSLDSLRDDLKKVGTSTLIDGDRGCTSVTANILCPSSSMSTGTSDELLLDDLKYDLKKEDVTTSIYVEFIPPVPVHGSEESKMPAGTLENITSEGMDDDLIKNSVSAPINGDADTFLWRNLRSASSNVIVEGVNNSASEPVDDDLRKEVVSAPDGGEAVAAIHDDLISSLSSTPFVGSADNILSGTLEVNHALEGVSTLHNRNIDKSVPDNLPCVLSSVLSGTKDNSCEEASEDSFNKEAVLKPGSMETALSGFRAMSDEDNHLSSSAGVLLKNPEAMMVGFEGHKILKSSFNLDVGADEEIKLVGNDKNVNVSENPVAHKDDLAENIENSVSGNLEYGFKNEGVSIPIQGEAGAFGFKGTSDEESHLLSATDFSSAVDNSEALIGEFKDYKEFKSSFSLDLGAAEIISLENDKKFTASENLPSSVSHVHSGNIDNSPSDALEDVLGKVGVSIPIDGEIDASEFKFNSDVDLGDYIKSSSCDTKNSEQNNNAKESLNQSIDGKSVQNEDSEPTSRQESDVFPLESGEQTLQMSKLCGSGNADNHGDDKLFHVAAGNGNIKDEDEPSNSNSATFARVETIPEITENPVLLVGNDSIDLENSSTCFSSESDIQTVEVTTEERSANQSHPTCESAQQLLRSDCLDEARNSHHMNVQVIASEKLRSPSESLTHAIEIQHNSEGLNVGDKTEVSNSSISPGIVSELKYEDPVQRLEQIHEGSSLKEVAAPALESQNMIDTPVLGPSHDNVGESITKPNLSFLAVDNVTASSSRTDSLEGNWGSVSVISGQSDVGNLANAIDTQVAEKLDNEFKKHEKWAALESHPDKSDDVFEPPSFMTLVESGVAVDKNSTVSELQKTETNEESKSESTKAGWFPSITNVVNESEGRKKNEEIISKVTNWSTGKQHSPLKNLLNEAQAETKVKSSSPNLKQVPAVNNETASASKNNNGITATTTTTTVSSILGSEMQDADTVKKEMEKEWNSPARYPIQVKKEKRKGKPYWASFVCCTSVRQDV